MGAGLLGLACLLGTSEFMVRYRVEPNDHFWRSVAVFYRAKSSKAVFGDSIAARGFHGVPEFVNFALPGESPVITELKLSAYLATRRPELVIISLNPNMFRRSAKINLQQYREIYYSQKEPWFKILKQRHKERMLGYWLHWLSGGNFRSNVDVPAQGGLLVHDHAENWKYSGMSEQARLEEAARNVARDLVAENFRQHENIEIFARMVALVRSKGGQVCLVGFPYSPEYRSLAQQYPRFAEARKFFRETAERIGARYADFWDRYDSPRYFLDPSHLNEMGAREFSPEAIQKCFGAPSSAQ